ncbi:MAG: NAD(P)H-binding protein [Candidatus Zixiibacteriota bacterium]
MAKILVIGGTGMLGRPVVVRLVQDGFSVRLFTTDEQRARAYFTDHVDYAEGDVGDLDSLKYAMEGCDAVYVNLKGGPSNDDYIRIEKEGSINIYEAAIETGLEKIVQISEARADENHSDFIPHRVKYEAEQELVSSGLTYTILKPTWFCESLPLFIKDNKAVYIGSGKSCFHFLAVADYVEIVAQCLNSDKADNKILTVFGPEPMPIPEAMRRFLEICYPTITIDQLPVWLARLSGFFLRSPAVKAAINLMAFFDKHDDTEVAIPPDETNAIFGAPKTTVLEWAQIYRKIVKGV